MRKAARKAPRSTRSAVELCYPQHVARLQQHVLHPRNSCNRLQQPALHPRNSMRCMPATAARRSTATAVECVLLGPSCSVSSTGSFLPHHLALASAPRSRLSTSLSTRTAVQTTSTKARHMTRQHVVVNCACACARRVDTYAQHAAADDKQSARSMCSRRTKGS